MRLAFCTMRSDILILRGEISSFVTMLERSCRTEEAVPWLVLEAFICRAASMELLLIING